MAFLKRVYEDRRNYFEDLDSYLREIKKIVQKGCPDAEICLFGSVVNGNYSIGLSDMDVAVVSDTFRDRDKKLNMFGKLTKSFFDSPFEFQVLTHEQWKFFRNPVKKYRRID